MSHYPINLPYRLVLGSGSPRRQQLLAELGLKFRIAVPGISEHYPPNLPATAIARYLAEQKAAAMLPHLAENELLITADTTVVYQDRLLEKAADSEEAAQMLRTLSGARHEVITGVCLCSKHKMLSFQQTTWVAFHPLDEETIAYYIQQYKPFDKAGAYGVQEWIGMVGVASIEGSYFNVVGLPLDLLWKNLKSFC